MNISDPRFVLLMSLLTITPGADFVLAEDGVMERAVPALPGPLQRASPLPVLMNGLTQRLGQLESEARAVQVLLGLPGSNPPALVAGRFPQLAALARQTAREARAVRDQARLEQQSQLEATADRIAADNDAIDRGMEEARAKAQQATQAATTQLLAGIIGSATQMKNAAGDRRQSGADARPADRPDHHGKPDRFGTVNQSAAIAGRQRTRHRRNIT